jgi:hypothetical protein
MTANVACRFVVLFGLVAFPAVACDWKVASDEVDPMTDERTCIIRSDSAKIAIGVRGESLTFLTGSAYTEDGLEIRVDDNKAIYIGEERSTSRFRDNARRAFSEIRQGDRLRTTYLDYPEHQRGDAPICNLPQLIESCQTQAAAAAQ